MKVVGIVPMKLNNQRLPQKNTKAFRNGKPLCHYILTTLLKVSGIDEVEVLQSFASEVPADIYVLAHTTSPFISAKSIEKGLKAVYSEKYDSSFAAKKVQDFLWKDGKPFNYSLDSIPRTQDLPVLYEETSGFYIFENHIITEWNRRIGNRPYIVEVNEIESIDIDEGEDFMIAEAIYNHLILKSGGGYNPTLNLLHTCKVHAALANNGEAAA